MKNPLLKIGASLVLCVMWFTRIPIPFRMPYSESLQQQSLAWLPGIGFLVGAVAYGTMKFATGWPTWFAALIGIALCVGITGALHEDGWADGWDAIGAGGDSSRKLSVLKDPRLGTFGVSALLFSLALQWGALTILAQHALLESFFLVQVASRWPLTWLAWKIPYLRKDGEGKAHFLRQKTEPWAWVVWVLWIPVLLYFGWAHGLQWWLVANAAMFTPILVALAWKKSLGGLTGDVFGFCQQAGLLTSLLVATWGLS